MAEDAQFLAELERVRKVAEALPTENENGSPESDDFLLGLRSEGCRLLDRLSEMESRFASEKTQSFYTRDGRPMMQPRGDNFRRRAATLENFFKGAEERLCGALVLANPSSGGSMKHPNDFSWE
jgi:hypothetical protein